MKVMTFNLRCDFILDFNNRWSERKDIVIETILNYSPDVIGVQELTEAMREDLINGLKGYKVVGRARSKKLFSERNDIFVKEEFNIYKHHTFWLSKTPHKVSHSSWYSIFPRICTVAYIKDNRNKEYRICNAHLDFLFSKSRLREIKRILAYIKEDKGAGDISTILMGDFNASPNSRVIEEIRESSINDKKFIAHGDKNNKIFSHATLGGFKGKNKGLHIDYIFVTNDLSIVKEEIVTFNKNGKYPSDHYPIICTIE